MVEREGYLTDLMRGMKVDRKLGILLFLTHLDVCLRRAYEELNERITREERELLETSQNDGTSRGQSQNKDDRANWICVPEPGESWLIYRRLTTIIHCCNSLKYVLVLIMVNEAFLPIEANCYLLGRLAAHYELSAYLIFIALALSVFSPAWRYTLLKHDARLEMDILVFLMHERETIETELKRIVKLNNRTGFIAMGRRLFPQNILQRCLFFKLDSGNNRSSYKLRPNRTEKSRKRLHAQLNRIFLALSLTVFLYAIIATPIWIEGALGDISFIRSYPSCCPLLEKMALNGSLDNSQKSFNTCFTKELSIPFDLLDNFVIYFDSFMLLILPLSLAGLITYDLAAYWEIIDSKAKCLVARMRSRNYLYPDKHENCKFKGTGHYCASEMFRKLDRLSLQLSIGDLDGLRGNSNIVTDIYDGQICELQSLLCDFFDCIGRADKFVRILLTFSVGLFLISVLSTGFFMWKIDRVYNLIIVRFLFGMAIINFVAGSSINLQLKKMIDRTYVDLCSIMAYDRSDLKLKWIIILECYTHKARNSFTVFKNVRFTWMFVLNVVATSLSFLLALATLKDQSVV